MKDLRIRSVLVSIVMAVMFGSVIGTAQNVNVTTWHNDIGRTGQNNQEIVLTTGLVLSTNTFGKVCSLTNVDGKIYGQPLVVTNVHWQGGAAKTVVYIATQNDTIYAVDGTSRNCNILGQVSLLVNAAQGEIAAQCADIGTGCGTIQPKIGILGTPVIELDNTNPATGTLYAVAQSECPVQTQCNQTNATKFFHRLHALDITTLNVTAYVQICATGCGGHDSTTFSRSHIQRPGLLWLSASQANRQNNMVYVAFSMIDGDNSYPPGFIFSYNAQNLNDSTSQFSYQTTSSLGALGGGIWQAGAGLAAGRDGNGCCYIYVSTADGTFDLNTSGPDAADSFLKLTPTLQLASSPNYFTPSDQCYRASQDLDLGSGGTLLLPDGTLANHQYVAIKPDKENYFWVMDRTIPASPGFDPGLCTQVQGCPLNGVPQCPPANWANHNLEAVSFATVNQTRSSPAFWSGNNSLFIAGTYTQLMRFPVSDTCPVPYPGAVSVVCNVAASSTDGHGTAVGVGFSMTPSVSSNYQNGQYSNGIAWAIKNPSDPPDPSSPGPAILFAFDAVTLNELYDSNKCLNNTDQPGLATKFSTPTIANGFVYIGTQTDFDIYGPVTRTGCNH